jgi:hypothetical protein
VKLVGRGSIRTADVAADGTFAFERVHEGSFTVRADGRHVASDDVFVSVAAIDVQADLTVRSKIHISGRATAASGGVPAKGSVVLRRSDGADEGTAKIGEDGAFIVSGLVGRGIYRPTVYDASGRLLPLMVPDLSVPAEAASIDGVVVSVIERIGDIDVVVRTATGDPVADAHVVATLLPGLSFDGWTDQTGVARFPDIPWGDYDFEARVRNSRARGRARVGQSTRIELKVDESAAIRVRLAGPRATTQVVVSSATGSAPIAATWVEESEFVVRGLQPGRYSVLATRGRSAAVAELNVGAGINEVALQPEAVRLEGRIRFPPGKPPGQYLCKVTSPPSFLWGVATTSETGEFRFDALPRGAVLMNCFGEADGVHSAVRPISLPMTEPLIIELSG